MVLKFIAKSIITTNGMDKQTMEIHCQTQLITMLLNLLTIASQSSAGFILLT